MVYVDVFTSFMREYTFVADVLAMVIVFGGLWLLARRYNQNSGWRH
jgi:hypothetical protein